MSTSRDHHIRHTAATIIMWTVAVLFTGAGVLCIIGFFIASPPPGSTEGAEIGSVVFTLGIGLITGFFAWQRRPVHVAHPKAQSRLASRQFVKIVDGKVIDGAAPGEPADATSPDLGPASPAAIASVPVHRWTFSRALRDARVHAALAVCGLAISIIVLFNELDGNAQSAYTQSHGVSVTATVSSYDNTESCNRGNCSYTFSAAASLSPPVDGAAITTIHGQGTFPGDQGAPISVLVDPKEPSYAELPGNRLRRVGGIVGAAIAVGLLALLALALCNRLLRHHPRRLPNRHLRAGTGPLGLP